MSPNHACCTPRAYVLVMPVALPLLAHTVPVLQADVEEAAFLAVRPPRVNLWLEDRCRRLGCWGATSIHMLGERWHTQRRSHGTDLARTVTWPS